MMWFAPLALIGMALFVFVGGEIVKELWNWLVPPVFGWRAITFWQALGLMVLSRILFGGFGRHGGGGRFNWRRRMEDRCRNMTPEERERFRQRIRERWGFDPAAGANRTDTAGSPGEAGNRL